MAVGNPVGRALASVVSKGASGYFTDIDGPSSVASANGLGQRNSLGLSISDDNGNIYVYCAGVASTAQGDWVRYIPGAFSTVRLVDNTAVTGLIAVAMAAIVANCWGWYQVFGLTPAFTAIKTDANADGKTLSINSGTASQLLPGPTTTKNVFGAVCVGASASNQGTAAIAYPFAFGTATI